MPSNSPNYRSCHAADRGEEVDAIRGLALLKGPHFAESDDNRGIDKRTRISD